MLLSICSYRKTISAEIIIKIFRLLPLLAIAMLATNAYAESASVNEKVDLVASPAAGSFGAFLLLNALHPN
jgi:hypothetical protein